MRGDAKKTWPVEERTTLGSGAISTFVNEVVLTPAGTKMNRQFLTHPGAVAVVALGKAGSREMTAGSDLDLMTLYDAPAGAASTIKDWSADVFYVRFTQRLISALSAHTAEGGLYEVDMRLRPSGSKGPVAVSLTGFHRYHAEEAWTWERIALTRARVVAAPPGCRSKVEAATRGAL